MTRNSSSSALGRDHRFSPRINQNDPLHGARVSRVALALGAGTLVLASVGAASAQELGGQFPFPSANGPSGVTTTALTTHELRELYLDWREALVERCPEGDARLRYPETNNDTRSEGVGYGMVIAAYMGDQETFDGLWNYYQRQSSGGLMNWLRSGCGGGGASGSAADADIDAALALLVGEKQFPGNGYAADAGTILGAIRTQLFNGGCQGVLLAGSEFDSCGCINPSYIPPGYYAAYAEVDQPDFWNQARDASYTYFNAVRNPQTGLVPAWSQVDGNLGLGAGCTPEVAGGGATSDYQADAARTPWRVATDYQWTGDPRAQDFLQSIGGFASGQDIMRIRDRYALGGLPATPNELSSHELGRNTYVMGGFATAMVAGDQAQIDDFTAAWISVYKFGDNYDGTFRAYNNSLALLYGLVLTGTMWSPFDANPTPVAEAPLTPATPGNLVVNGDFDEGVLGWQAFSDYYDYGGTLTFTSSDGFALHAGGEMRLRVVRNEPAAPQRLSLRQTVSVQAGQRYRLSVDARAEAPRALRVAVQGEDSAYGAIVVGEDGTFTVDTEMRTYQTVFEATATDPAALLVFEFGHSSEDVTVDNVILEPTDLAVDPGSAVGGPAPAPGTPGSPGGGTEAAAPGDGTLGTVDAVGDAPGTPAAPAGQPGGLTPGLAPSSPGNPSAPSPQNCAPAAYSPELNLCYDPSNGNVWDPSLGIYTRPPQHPGCGADEQNPGQFYYWWPLIQACYDPASGTAFDTSLGQWAFVGTNFTVGQRGSPADSGCAVSPASEGGGGSWAQVALLGLAGAAVSVRRRRFR